jgi:hypothetical protein
VTPADGADAAYSERRTGSIGWCEMALDSNITIGNYQQTFFHELKKK